MSASRGAGGGGGIGAAVQGPMLCTGKAAREPSKVEAVAPTPSPESTEAAGRASYLEAIVALFVQSVAAWLPLQVPPPFSRSQHWCNVLRSGQGSLHSPRWNLGQ